MGIFQKKGKWYIDFYLQGRRIRRAVGHSKRLAEKALKAVQTDIERGEYRFQKEKKTTFEHLAAEYLEYAKVNKKSWRTDEYNLKALKHNLKGMMISRISSKHIEDLKREWLEKVSPATINRRLSLLRFMFSLGIRWRLADKNPVTEVRPLQERRLEMHILTEDEAEKLIDAAADHLKPIIIVALGTGMRKGEILNLRWSDIDFAVHFIFIKETKSGNARKVPMNGPVAETLKGIKREGEHVFYYPETKEKISNIKRSFKTACRRAALPDLRFHDLRHSVATTMVSGGVDLVTVKEILGHSKIETTMRYAHPTPENKRKAVNVLAYVFGKKNQEIDRILSYRENKKDSNSQLQSN